MKDKIWLFVLWIRLVDDEIQMTQPELLSVAEIEASLWQKYYVHSCTPHCLKKIEPKGLMYRENLITPPCRRIFGAIFPLRHGSRRFAPRPRYARDAMLTLQNRAKNGLTSGGIE